MIPASKPGIGGAPTRNTTLPTDPVRRKEYPMATGFFDYFPDAIAAIAHLSWKGNQQHNLGKELHWDRTKSGDEADTMLRHFSQRGTLDTDKISHTVKAAWRMLAILQKEIEAEEEKLELVSRLFENAIKAQFDAEAEQESQDGNAGSPVGESYIHGTQAARCAKRESETTQASSQADGHAGDQDRHRLRQLREFDPHGGRSWWDEDGL